MGIRSWVAGSALATAFTPREGELFAGVEKPSTTLVKMLIAEMVQHVDKATCRDAACYATGCEKKVWSFPSFHIDVVRKRDEWRHSVDVPLGVRGFTLKADPDFRPDAHETKLLNDAMTAWMPLRVAFKANEKEGARQQKAVDLIESLFKPKPAPEVLVAPAPMAEPDLSMFDAPKMTIRERKLGL